MKAREKTTVCMLANMALLALFGGALTTAPAPLAAAEDKLAFLESRPVESNGVAFVVGAPRKQFESNEPLTLRATFGNTTAEVIWLPRYLQILRLEETTTGKRFTGVTARPGGSMGLPQPPPIRLRPHESHRFVVEFKDYGFVEGDLDNSTARNELFRIGKELRPDAPGRAQPPPLPPGIYQLTAEIRSPDHYREAIAVTLKNSALCRKQATDVKDEDYEFHDEECRISDLPEEFDLASLWKVDVLRSNPIEIHIAGPKSQ